MSHQRSLIIQSLVDRLAAHEALAGVRVFKDPDAAQRVPPEELPAILVRPGEEAPEEIQETGPVRRYRRVLELKIEAVAAPLPGQTLDAILDALDLAIEQVVQADETQGGLVRETILAGTEFPPPVTEGSYTLAAVVQTYLVTYQFPN